MSENKQVNALGESIRTLVKGLGSLEKSELTCCGIPFSQYNAILEIGKVGVLNLNELSDILNLDKSTLSKTVNNLVTSEWVTREIDSNDRRYVTICLTQKGSEAYQDIQNMLKSYYNKIYTAIPQEKRDQVIESVEVLLNAISTTNCCI